MSSVHTGSTDRLVAARVVQVPVYESLYRDLPPLQPTSGLVTARRRTPQVDSGWRVRRQSAGPSPHDEELFAYPDPVADLPLVPLERAGEGGASLALAQQAAWRRSDVRTDEVRRNFILSL